jgi:hypothetical protein
VKQEITRAKASIAELRLSNKKANQHTHTLKNLLTVQRLLLEQLHRSAPSTLRIRSSVVVTSNNANVIEKEPPKPPPDEDEPKPPIEEPPTEEPPVKEPPPKNN